MRLPRFSRALFAIGCMSGLSFVAIAALAAHALSETPVRAMDQALLLHAAHAPAILAAALLARPLAALAGGAFALGTLLFSFSIYSHYLLGIEIPAVAPIGGTTLMLGWSLLLAAGLRASIPPATP